MEPLFEQRDPSALEDVFDDPSVADFLRRVSPNSFSAAAGFWRTPFTSTHLSPRMKELLLLAMHASATAVNPSAIDRHVERAKIAGASDGDILDVLLSIVGAANHSLYACVPLLMEELKEESSAEPDLPVADVNFEALKEEFIKTRGFWNRDRDALFKLMPDYFQALTRLSVEPWQSGTLAPKEREFIYIGIDCNVTHTYLPGLRLHIRNAIKHGATRDEILEIFQLAALMGLEGYMLGSLSLWKQARSGADKSMD